MLRFIAFLITLSVLLGQQAVAQVYEPVTWSFEVTPAGAQTYNIIATATIEEKWHLYAANISDNDLPEDAITPMPTEIFFDEHPAVQAVGELQQGAYITHYDPNFDMDLNYFEESAVFTQTFKVAADPSFTTEAQVSYMACDDTKCIFPDPEILLLSFENGVMTKLEVNGNIVFGDDPEVSSNQANSGSTIFEPATWSMRAIDEGNNTYILEFTCDLDQGWHLYSQNLETDAGPVATEFAYELPEGHTLNGLTAEPTPKVEYDPNFMMDLAYFEKQAIFTQRITVEGTPGTVKGGVLFMLCDDSMCLPPDVVDFEINLATGSGGFVSLDTEEGLDISTLIPHLPRLDLENPAGECGEVETYDSYWTVFFFGFIGGLLALLTPCVFPMIPLTVSFFTKGGNDRSSGLGKAVLYGIFIFLIYAVLSVPFHFGTDPEVLNEIATSATLNMLFFVIFIVFAISFFGYFEITLPSGWLNKADEASSKTGGMLGIFFMALTLALVSFSCTGPILGTVLGNSLKDGPWPISYAMSGFGIALGLPFALFAAFPSWLNNLPKSGGWLNSVKVVLGFLELGLALKFLSNADLVYRWGLIKRETFFLVWIILGIGLTLYLFGLIRFPHDSPIKKLSWTRRALATASLVFTVYLIPGIFPNPTWEHNLLAGFPPPKTYSWFEREDHHFKDFNEGMAFAKEVGKPVLLDFTGWACVNCRQMEENVWIKPEINRLIEEDFVLISLYVDDKVELPADKQGVFEFEADGKMKKKQIRTTGNKWATFQTHVFNNNSQPYYVMLSPDGDLLGNPIGYTPDVDTYRDYLRCGLRAFHEQR